MKDGPITKKQLQYICILSSYEDTRVEDTEDIISFLMSHNKKSLRELTKAEASELIQILLKRPVTYEFPCGETAKLHKRDYNAIMVMGGYFEACIHHCPRKRSIYDCKPFSEMYYFGGIISKDELMELPKCEVCRRIPLNEEQYEYIKKEYPELLEKFYIGKLHMHHISYKKNLTVTVCPKCHREIHNNPNHRLYPEDRR